MEGADRAPVDSRRRIGEREKSNWGAFFLMMVILKKKKKNNRNPPFSNGFRRTTVSEDGSYVFNTLIKRAYSLPDQASHVRPTGYARIALPIF